MAEVLMILTIALPWLGALAVWAWGDDDAQQRGGWYASHRLAVAFSAAAGLAALALLPSVSSTTVLRIPIGGMFGELTFVPDGLGVFLTVVATVIGCLAVVFSVDYMRGERQQRRYYAFVLFFIGAMAGLALTGSLLFLFFFWEITALCSYVLISFYNDDPKAVAGGIKALIITQIGGAGLLAGALLAYAYTGSYDIGNFIEKAPTLPAAVLAAMAFGFLAAAAAKSAQFPFQTWLPDAMEAPTPISALIHAATMVNAGVYLLARFYPAFEHVPGWRTAVMVVGLITALLAAFMGLAANDLKRVLAYSTVSQLGYMVYAIGVGGVFASAFHLLSHAVFKALLFLAAGAVIHAVGTRDMRDMGGLGQRMPFVRNVFIVGALALAGLPILNGFWSKELILEAGLEGGPGWALVGMILGAGLTALYTARMTWLVFFGQPRSDLHAHDATSAMRVSLGALAVGALTTWLLVGPFSRMLAETLPFHEIEHLGLWEMTVEILAAPVTWLAMGVIGIGLAAWGLRERLAGVTNSLGWLSRAAQASFGFEWINRRVVQITQGAASLLRVTQTGELNWNVLGIVGGLVFILAILVWGVR